MSKIWHLGGGDKDEVVTQNRQRSHTSSAPCAHFRCPKLSSSCSREAFQTALVLIKQGPNRGLLQELPGLKSSPASQNKGTHRLLSLLLACAAYRRRSGSSSMRDVCSARLQRCDRERERVRHQGPATPQGHCQGYGQPGQRQILAPILSLSGSSPRPSMCPPLPCFQAHLLCLNFPSAPHPRLRNGVWECPLPTS